MNRHQAERRMRRKITKVKPCPFCGSYPLFRTRCDTAHSSDGFLGHFASREGCCTVTSTGQTKLFFCNNYKKPNYKLWWQMLNRMVDDWNRRIEPSVHITPLEVSNAR